LNSPNSPWELFYILQNILYFQITPNRVFRVAKYIAMIFKALQIWKYPNQIRIVFKLQRNHKTENEKKKRNKKIKAVATASR
jgi:hypothetical protein